MLPGSLVGLAVALASLILAAPTGGEEPTARCAPSAAAPSRLYLAAYKRMTIVNVPRQRVRTVEVPQSEAGDFPYNIVRRGGCFVVWSYIQGRGYTVFALDSRMHAKRLASHTRLFIPSSRPSRIWVLLGDRTHPWDGRLRAVREVSVSGQVTVPGTRPPGGREPVASVGSWLLLGTRHNMIPWNPRTGRVGRRLSFDRLGYPWSTPYGRVLATCRRYCRSILLTHVASGRRREIDAPPGDFFDAGEGAFSPDGKLIAIALRRRKADPGGSVPPRLAIAQLRSGRVSIIPRSRVPGGYVYVAWSSSGRHVFITGGGYEHRKIVTYRVGNAHARRVRVRVGQFYGVAAG